MGARCSTLGSFFSIVIDALERISLCTVCAALVCCVLFTVISVMLMGIGIGYHYCFVHNSVGAMAAAAANSAGDLRTGPEGRRGGVVRSVDKSILRGFAHRMARREADSPHNFTDTNNMYNFTETGNISKFTETDNINNFTDSYNLTVINSQPELSFRTLTTKYFTVF